MRSNNCRKICDSQKEGEREVERQIEYYSLDVIISVGYRVKSKRGVEFRCWANSVLKQYILKGYAVNDNRIKQLGEVIRIMKRTETELDSRQVLSVIEKYSSALDLLDAYDHQNMIRPEGNHLRAGVRLFRTISCRKPYMSKTRNVSRMLHCVICF